MFTSSHLYEHTVIKDQTTFIAHPLLFVVSSERVAPETSIQKSVPRTGGESRRGRTDTAKTPIEASVTRIGPESVGRARVV